MTPGRRRRRGYDHAGLLARRLARRTGAPVAAGALRRTGGRADHQLGAGRAERLAGTRLSVHARPGRLPSGRRVVLVDDVHTTGATLDACARALRQGGVPEVLAVTAVRALRGA
ncbi:ComF family protein [Conexibacter sp. W3-3-2]|uniref:ComF family protein n=1 Tax=Conexibacter sp. W3-3-2 TaxID=2675227 RepID=UPI0018AB6E79|nr:phosphoribosyltransferase family protein [Conexibacter sp. W3-3-2]